MYLDVAQLAQLTGTLPKGPYGRYLLRLSNKRHFEVKITRLTIPDIVLIEPEIFGDERGFFFESFNQRQFDAVLGCSPIFVQDNHSRSLRATLRGLHYQLPPKAQGKLVRVISGEVFDVAVDIRRKSSTFGQWAGSILSAENRCQLWIPEGFAHGFSVLSETAEFLYKTTDYYAPDFERCILWDDPDIDIQWPFDAVPVLSAKDRAGVAIAHAEIFE